MFTAIGTYMTRMFDQIGGAAQMVRSSLFWLTHSRFEFRQAVDQSVTIGVESLGVTALTSLFTGMVLALQAGNTIGNIFGEPIFVGTIVTFSLIRELGPVLTSVVVSGRAGAAVTAQIGTMAVTEQIDALTTLSTNPLKYLVAPRIWAGLVVMPLLVLIGDVIGIFGGYVVGVYKLGFNPANYINATLDELQALDITTGVVKAAVFGFIISLMGCYNGYKSKGGAQGVGEATTNAVVSSSILILIFNYIITELFFAK